MLKYKEIPAGEGLSAVKGVWYYLLVVSAIGALVSIYDKIAARNGWGRVPERTLFFWTLVGGGPGVYASMLLIRHSLIAAPQLYVRHPSNYDITISNLYGHM